MRDSLPVERRSRPMEPPPGALRPRRRRHWIPALTILVAVLLTVASIGAVYINLGHMRESFAWVQHTDEVLSQASEMDAGVVEAESAERGYLLTGDDDFRSAFGPDGFNVGARVKSAAHGKHGTHLCPLRCPNRCPHPLCSHPHVLRRNLTMGGDARGASA
jgi:hypothetical protein